MRWFILLTILLFTTSPSLAQNKTEPSKVTTTEAVTTDGKLVLLKSDGTWEYSKKTAPVKSQNDEKVSQTNTPIITTPEKVALSPNDFTDKIVKFEKVYVGELKSISELNNQFFSMNVQSVQGKTFPAVFLPTMELNFITEEKIARQLLKFFEENKSKVTWFNMNLYARIAKSTDDANREYKVAAVLCIEFLDVRGRIINRVGWCN